MYFRGRHRRSDIFEKYIAAQAKSDSNKKYKKACAEVLVALTGPVLLDDEFGGCSDDDFEPIPLMDEDHKEALLDNEDGEDEEDDVEEVAEGGAGDELSSNEGRESSAESIEF